MEAEISKAGEDDQTNDQTKDPFQKWRHVTCFREVEDKHQNK